MRRNLDGLCYPRGLRPAASAEFLKTEVIHQSEGELEIGEMDWAARHALAILPELVWERSSA